MKTHLTLQKIVVLVLVSLVFSATKLFAQPENDLIENAINLDELPEDYSGQNIQFQDATFAGDATPAPCDIGVAGIWYKFTAAKEGTVGALILSETNSILIFFEGPANATSGQELTYVDQNSNPCIASGIPSIETIPGKTYYLFAKNDVETDLEIIVGEAYQIPINDHIEDATDLNNLPNYTEENIHTSRVNNIDDGGQQNCNTQATPGIWYTFTPSFDGEVTATTSFGVNNGFVAFYESVNPNPTSGTDLTWVNQLTNPCGLTNESSIDAEAGKVYYIFVASTETYIDLSIDLNNVLGTGENTLEGFTFYPNPVSETLHVKAKNSIETIKIFNIMGQQVFKSTVGATQTQITLSNLKSGVYMLQAASEGRIQTFKIIKK